MAGIICFDIGIKNLAFCILENQSSVLALENCNLLEPVETTHCKECKLKASFTVNNQQYCKRHIPKSHSVIQELNKKKSYLRKINRLRNNYLDLLETNDKFKTAKNEYQKENIYQITFSYFR